MADATTVSLLPVVVGGLLTMGGGVIGGGVTLLSSYFLANAEKKKCRAEKFEELVAAVYEFDHWLGRKENAQVFGEEEKLEPSPFAKVEAISAVYFPQFVEKIIELQKTARAYEVWMTEAWQKRVHGKTDKLSEGVLDVFNPYSTNRESLLTDTNGAKD